MDSGRAFPIRTGSSSFQSNVASGHARVHMGDVYNVTHSGSAPPSLREQILDSLWFDMMEARQDSIKGATPETLDWIYDSDFEDPDSQISDSEEKDDQDPDSKDHEQLDPADEHRDAQDPYNGDLDSQDSSSETQDEQDSDDDQAEQWQHSVSRRRRDWDSLAQWLKEDNSIYWVCGKAGSGKSTLMAHIVDDDRTSDRLSKWAKGKSLHILKFFFWRPGTELQKSVTGLLRALLWQVCDELEDASSKVAKASRWHRGRQAAWTDKRLTIAIVAALTSSDDVFCFFLDGLDEFVGDLSTLIELVYHLDALDNVKICVSSRPEAELTANFSSCKQLRLERLNHSDIERFVRRQFRRCIREPMSTFLRYGKPSTLVEDVVKHADGVFLWAVLVVPTLVKGINSGDDYKMLRTRLKTTPAAIDDLFASMVADLDPLHRESLAFYLQVLSLFGGEKKSKVTVAQIAAAQLGESLLNMPYKDFLHTCDLERLRIISRSAGLLQIAEDRHDHDIVKCVAIPHLSTHAGASTKDIHSVIDAAKLRTSMTGSVPNAKAHIQANCDSLVWIHRSAHDFIFPPDGSASPIWISDSTRADACNRFMLGNLRLLAVSPSFVTRVKEKDRDSESTTQKRLSCFIQIMSSISKTDSATIREVSREIRAVVSNMPREEFGEFHLTYDGDEPYQPHDVFPFWDLCFHSEAWSVIQTLLPELLSELTGNALFMPLWGRITSAILSYACVDSTVESIILPFLKQVGQNIWLTGEASARVVVYFHGSFSRVGAAARFRIRHLSCTVPDFLESRQPHAIFAFFRLYFSAHPIYTDEVMAGLDKIAESICVFSGIRIRSPYGKQAHREHVVIQCSPRLWQTLRQAPVRGSRLLQCYNEFRILFLPTGSWTCDDENVYSNECGEIVRFIHFAPSSHTCVCLAQDIQRRAPESGTVEIDLDAALLDKWTQVLIEDIWENTQGLDATQQLYALACVKRSIPRWLDCTLTFS